MFGLLRNKIHKMQTRPIDQDIKRAARTKKMIRALWTINFCGVALVMLIGVMIYHGYIGYMPPVEGLLNPEDRFASRLFTSDGVEMGRFIRAVTTECMPTIPRFPQM